MTISGNTTLLMNFKVLIFLTKCFNIYRCILEATPPPQKKINIYLLLNCSGVQVVKLKLQTIQQLRTSAIISETEKHSYNYSKIGTFVGFSFGTITFDLT